VETLASTANRQKLIFDPVSPFQEGGAKPKKAPVAKANTATPSQDKAAKHPIEPDRQEPTMPRHRRDSRAIEETPHLSPSPRAPRVPQHPWRDLLQPFVPFLLDCSLLAIINFFAALLMSWAKEEPFALLYLNSPISLFIAHLALSAMFLFCSQLFLGASCGKTLVKSFHGDRNTF
jgi:hypothetical protein